MGVDRVLRYLICFLLAFAVSALLFWYDASSSRDGQMNLALNWARQVSKQAESLALHAREKGMSSPLTWATQQLSRGVDPRPLKVDVVANWDAAEASQESYEWNSVTGSFDYISRLSFPSRDGNAVRVQASFAPRGFAGTSSEFLGHLLILTLFLAGFYLFLALSRRFAGGTKNTVPEQNVAFDTFSLLKTKKEKKENEEEDKKEQVAPALTPVPEVISYLPRVNELDDINSSLSHLAAHVRKVVMSTKEMVGAAKLSKSGFAGMMSDLDGTFRQFDQMKDHLADIADLAEQCRSNSKEQSLSDLEAQLAQLLTDLDSFRAELKSLEQTVLPWGQRIREVEDLQQGILDKGSKIHQVISDATQSMTLHTEHIEELEAQARSQYDEAGQARQKALSA